MKSTLPVRGFAARCLNFRSMDRLLTTFAKYPASPLREATLDPQPIEPIDGRLDASRQVHRVGPFTPESAPFNRSGGLLLGLGRGFMALGDLRLGFGGDPPWLRR